MCQCRVKKQYCKLQLLKILLLTFYLSLQTNISTICCHLHSKEMSPCCLVGFYVTMDHLVLSDPQYYVLNTHMHRFDGICLACMSFVYIALTVTL